MDKTTIELEKLISNGSAVLDDSPEDILARAKKLQGEKFARHAETNLSVAITLAQSVAKHEGNVSKHRLFAVAFLLLVEG